MEVVKRQTRMPEITVAMPIVPLRPIYFMSTVMQARKEPGTPTAEVMA